MSRHRILIADDDPDVRAVVGAALRAKYEVIEAVDGRNALDRLERYQPDFALIDPDMPRLDGYELCRSIRRHQHFRALPVIFYSGHTTRDDIRKGYESGGNLYLTKPLDPQQVLKNIDLTITQSKLPVRAKRHSLTDIKRLDEEEDLRLIEEEQRRRYEPKTPPPPPPPPPRPEPVREARPFQGQQGSAASASSSSNQSPPPSGRQAPIESDSVEDEEFEWEEEQGAPEGEYEDDGYEDLPLNDEPVARVMIVEDEEDTRNMLSMAMREQFEVISLRDGFEAIEHMGHDQPDIILMDLMLPKMNGFQLLQALRRSPQYKDLPIIIVSAKSTRRDRDYVSRLGATGFVAKPFEIQEVLDTVESIVYAPDFKITKKRAPIEEIVEREFLKAQQNAESQHDENRKQRYKDLHDILHEENQQKKMRK